jgi:dTDP-glucose 4,6-dehydratase
MKNVLITGGCGFIGSSFVQLIIAHSDFHPVVLDKLTYAGNLDNLNMHDKDEYTFIKGDICDELLVSKLFEKYKFNAVFHFAAESHVDRSIDGPKEFIQSNIIGTFTLLQTSLQNKKNLGDDFKFIHVSTDEVYGDLNDGEYFKETTPYAPNSPYSASKAASDHLVRAWGKTFGLPTIITNCSNNYGPYQFPEKLIPLMIINCLSWKPLPVYGDGQNVRDWLHVTDHCHAIFSVFNHGRIHETYNIGGNNEIKNIEIVETICEILDKIKPSKNNTSYKKLITFVKDRPGHDFRYAIDSSKIQNELGWKPKESFNSVIEKTIKWYIENESWWSNIQKKRYNQERLGRIL